MGCLHKFGPKVGLIVAACIVLAYFDVLREARELARVLGVPASPLLATVVRLDANAANGTDEIETPDPTGGRLPKWAAASAAAPTPAASRSAAASVAPTSPPPVASSTQTVAPTSPAASSAPPARSMPATPPPAAAATRSRACAPATSLSLGPAWGTSCPLVDLELVSRVHSGSEKMLRGALLSSLRVYWPHERFGRVATVFDDNAADRQAAERIEREFGALVRPVFANRAIVDARGGSPTNAGSPGYHLQQFDTLHMDYFSNATFIGVVDSDSLLVTAPTESDFFDDALRPRIIPRVEAPWGDLWSRAAGASMFMVGKPQPFRCMSQFPVIWRRKHFAQFRAHVEKTHDGKPFGTVYSEMTSQYGLFYSQFNLMCTWLWHYVRDEYEWSYWLPHGRAGPEWAAKEAAASASIPGALTDFSYVTVDNSMPVARPFVHWQHAGNRMRPDLHMLLGFCWLVRGDHKYCRSKSANFLKGQQQQFNSSGHLQGDLFYFEFVGYEDSRVLDANRIHFDRVRGEVDRGLWSIDGLATLLVRLYKQYAEHPPPFSEPAGADFPDNWLSG